MNLSSGDSPLGMRSVIRMVTRTCYHNDQRQLSYLDTASGNSFTRCLVILGLASDVAIFQSTPPGTQKSSRIGLILLKKRTIVEDIRISWECDPVTWIHPRKILYGAYIQWCWAGLQYVITTTWWFSLPAFFFYINSISNTFCIWKQRLINKLERKK